MAKNIYIRVRLHPIYDSDLISFKEKQKDMSKIMKLALRELIHKHGNTNLQYLLGQKGHREE